MPPLDVRCIAAILGVVIASAPAADARSCIRHAYEHMDVELDRVYSGGKLVSRPPELQPLDQIVNSGNQGKSILFWHVGTSGFRKFYKLANEAIAAPAIEAYLDASSARTLQTSCGYAAPYTPILPGEYQHSEDDDGDDEEADIERPVLVIAPGRDVVELRFAVRGVDYHAVYRVTCAYFEWGEREPCAPTAPSVPSGAAATSPPAAAPPLPSPTPSRGCRGCGTGQDVGWLVLLAFVALVRSRKREAIERAR